MSFPNLDRCSCGSPNRDNLKNFPLRIEQNQNNYLKNPVKNNVKSKNIKNDLKAFENGDVKKNLETKKNVASKHSRRNSDASVYTFLNGNASTKAKYANDMKNEKPSITTEKEKVKNANNESNEKIINQNENSEKKIANKTNDENVNVDTVKAIEIIKSNTACVRPLRQVCSDNTNATNTNNNNTKQNGVQNSLNISNQNVDDLNSQVVKPNNEMTNGELLKNNSGKDNSRRTFALESSAESKLTDNTQVNDNMSNIRSQHNIRNDDDRVNDEQKSNDRSAASNDGNNSTSQEYTALSYDVNYVKVSPPRLTRRSKKSEETSMEKLTTGSLSFKPKKNSHQNKRLFKAPPKTPCKETEEQEKAASEEQNEKEKNERETKNEEKELLEVTFTVLVEKGAVKSMNPNVKVGSGKKSNEKLQIDPESKRNVVESINEALKKSIQSQFTHPAQADCIDGFENCNAEIPTQNQNKKDYFSFDYEKRNAPDGRQSPFKTEIEFKKDESLMCYQSLDRKQSMVQLKNGKVDLSYEMKLGKEKYQTLANFGTLRKINKLNQTNITTTAVIHAPFDADVHKEAPDHAYHGRFTSNLCEYRHEGKENKAIGKEISYSFWKKNKTSMSSIAVEDEATHMNWDDLMKEAKNLGIPLKRPIQEPIEKPRHKSFSFSSRLFSALSSNWLNWKTDNQMTTSLCGGDFGKQNRQDLYNDHYKNYYEDKKESFLKDKLGFLNFLFGKSKPNKLYDADCPVCRQQKGNDFYQYKMLPQSAHVSPKHFPNPPKLTKGVKRSVSTHRPKPIRGEYFFRDSCPECPPCTCYSDYSTNFKTSRFSLSPATKCYKKCLKKVNNLSNSYHDPRANKSLHNFNPADTEYRYFPSKKSQQHQYLHQNYRQLAQSPAILSINQQYYRPTKSNLKYPFQRGSYEERNSETIGENVELSEKKEDDDDVFLDEIDSNNNFMQSKTIQHNGFSNTITRPTPHRRNNDIRDENDLKSCRQNSMTESGSLKHDSKGSFAKANNFKLYTGSTNGTSTKKSCKSESSDSNKNNMKLYKSLQLLKNKDWYWGSTNFEEAELALNNKPDGSFLVRDSSDERYILSVSFRSQGKTHHTRIEVFDGVFSFYSQRMLSSSTSAAPIDPGSSSSIIDFIEEAVKRSRAGDSLYYLRGSSVSSGTTYNENPPTPVQLLHPVAKTISQNALVPPC